MADYQIQPGDTLSKIAKMYGTTVKQLQKMNGIKNANLIFAGSTLKVPDVSSDEAFNVPGFVVEKDPKGGTKQKLLYGIPVPRDGQDSEWHPPLLPPKDKKLPEFPRGEEKPLYAYIPPRDGKEPKPEPMYAYQPPKDGKEPKPEPMYAYQPPKDGKEPKPEPMYAYQPPKGGEDPTLPFPWPTGPIKYRPIYAYIPPKGGEKPTQPVLPDLPENPPVRTVYSVLIPPEDKPEIPWLPKPGNPENPEKPGKPDKPGNPEKPDKPGNGDDTTIRIRIRRRRRRKPTQPGDGATPEKPVKPTPEKPVKPTPEKPVKPTPEKPVKPTPEKPTNPENPPKKEKPPRRFSD